MIQNNLEQIMKQKGMTTRELAKVTGETEHTIYLIKKGKTAGIKFDTWVNIHNALKLSDKEQLFVFKSWYNIIVFFAPINS